MISCITELKKATSVPGLIRTKRYAWSASCGRCGSTTSNFVPRFAACLKKVAATGWLLVALVPHSRATSLFSMSRKVVDTAPEPIVSISAATELAWHRRVQWSTLLVPKPTRTSFWNRYASSLLHFAEPKPASARGPCVSRTPRSLLATSASASSQLASRKCGSTSRSSTRPPGRRPFFWRTAVDSGPLG